MYNKAQAQDSQHQLIERYASLVKRIAYHLLARIDRLQPEAKREEKPS